MRAANAIVREEIDAASLDPHPWQYFAVLTPVQSVGVMGDGRTYANLVAVRAITSEDGMTADWRAYPRPAQAHIGADRQRGARRQPRGLRHHAKPPATVEWERVVRILVIGNGAREDALSWRLAGSPSCEAVFAAPGNAGTASRGGNWPIAATDGKTLAERCKAERIDLVVLGPETAIASGVGDRLREAGIAVFGPNRAAGRLESSKCSASGSWSATPFRPLAPPSYIRSTSRTRRSKRGGARWSSRPTDWPRARASSSRRAWNRLGPC